MYKSRSMKLTLSCLLAVLLVLALGVSALGRAEPGKALRPLVRGVSIAGANGLGFDANDLLYVGSVWGGQILVIDPRSGKIIQRLELPPEAAAPDDLIFGPDGSLYWTSITTGYVGRMKPDGSFTTQFVAMGVNPITFSSDGRLFVALDFLGDGLYEVDPELTAPPIGIIIPSTDHPMPLGFMNGFDFGPDGRLYGPIYTQGIVISLDVDSCVGTSTPWLDCDITVVADGFGVPGAVKFNALGELYVVDMHGPLWRVDVSTGEKILVRQLSKGLDNLAFDSAGQLFITNAQDGSIVEILPNSRPRFVSKGGVITTGGLAVLPRQNGGASLFVADLWALKEFDVKSGRLRHSENSIPGLSEIISPLTVSADGHYLVLTSWVASMVQVWDPITRSSVATYPFAAPLNAIRFLDNLLVADLVTSSVVWASTGAPVIGPPYVFVPTGLAASGGDLFVADWATGNVWQVYDEGIVMGEPSLVVGGLAQPEGMAIDLDGNLLVVETGADRLVRINRESGALSILLEGLPLGRELVNVPPTAIFSGVAVGPTGVIYLAGDEENIIYQLLPK